MSEKNPTRVLLVDDHLLVREMLAEQLSRGEEFAVVGLAGTAEEALEIAREERPDVIVMDVDMPGLICFDAARRIRSVLPSVQILFLSGHLHDRYIASALDVGALGYVAKSASTETIKKAIREVAASRPFFSDEVRSRLAQGAATGASDEPTTRSSLLSLREKEVLQYIARGMAKKTIAATMHVSVKTVEKHTENLMRKLAIHDRVELARYAIRERLIEP